MSTDDTADDESDEDSTPDVRERIEMEADRAVEQFDESIVDLLSWVLDTETRARIYVHLRQHSHSTSDEIAEGTGLYPSTVREALAELHDEGKVSRAKRESGGAGNNPYEYSAISPSDLVAEVVEDVQAELNTVFNLDRYLSRGPSDATDEEPVTISVEDATDEREATEETADDEGADDDGTGDEGADDDGAGDEPDADVTDATSDDEE